MNTHPTHTQVGGWGLWPMIVPIGVGVLFLLLLHACVLVSVCVCVCFGVGVYVVGVFWFSSTCSA